MAQEVICDRCGRPDGYNRVVVTKYVIRSPNGRLELWLCQRDYKLLVKEFKVAKRQSRTPMLKRPPIDPFTMEPKSP